MWLYITYIILSMSAAILMKVAGGDTSISLVGDIIQAKIGIKLILALCMYAGSFLLWTIILNKNDMSYIMPMTAAITNTLAVICGIFVFKEVLTLNQIIGIIVATVGILIMNWK
ncbi:MAG: hypothetical protein E6590_06635 [Clostridiales bacterium]|nr:hypothetical protein [Clostridiales bacterium]MDU6359633.1 hypothetical protein [Clostridiales bacterium]